jgi:hypothetical protein
MADMTGKPEGSSEIVKPICDLLCGSHQGGKQCRDLGKLNRLSASSPQESCARALQQEISLKVVAGSTFSAQEIQPHL